MEKEKNIKVSIICTAYNHERYIGQALDGMLMQKTDFDYDIWINDDASTDNTAYIIKKYEEKFPDKIHAIYQEKNIYSTGVNPSNILIEKANGEYIAFCEGDDFWTDINKLQKQVEYMDAHDECALCAHAGYYTYENGVIKKQIFKISDKECDISTEEVLSSWLYPTASIMYRQSMRTNLFIPFRGNSVSGDFCLSVYMALKGKIHYFPEPMCAYRQMSVSSLSLSQSKDSKGAIKRFQSMSELYERINTYSEYRYNILLMKLINEMRFNKAIVSGNMKDMKNNELYLKSNILKKCYLSLKTRFTFVIRMNVKIYNFKEKMEYPIAKLRTKKMNIANSKILTRV